MCGAEEQLAHASALATGDSHLSRQGRVAIQLVHVVLQGQVGVVQKVILQATKATLQHHALVDRISGESATFAPEKPQHMAWVPAPVAYPPPHEKSQPGHGKTVDGGPASEPLLDLPGECVWHPLVGVYPENPLTCAPFQGETLGRRIATPWHHVHLIGELPRDLLRVVITLSVDNHDLVGPGHAFQAGGNVVRFVTGDDNDR